MKTKYDQEEIREILNEERIQFLYDYFRVHNLENLVLFLNAQEGIEYQTGRCYDELIALMQDGVDVLNNCIYQGLINKQKDKWHIVDGNKYVFDESFQCV